MDGLLDELDKAIDARLFYVALILALTIPDICSALESENGRASRQLYEAWANRWFLVDYDFVTSNDLYSLRCGVVHQGRFGHPNMQYQRIVFTLPDGRGNVFHQNIINDALNLDAEQFCKDMGDSAYSWWMTYRQNPLVQNNLSRLVQRHENGLPPYIVGVPVIS